MKIKKRKTKPKFKVIYEYVPSPDAEERANRAYDMLFDKIDPFDPSTSSGLRVNTEWSRSIEKMI